MSQEPKVTRFGADPTVDQELATKFYVDNTGGGGADRGCRAFNSVSVSIADGAPVFVDLDSEDYDTDGYHNPAVNPSRLTIPSGLAGKYMVGLGCEFATNAVGIRIATVQLNGALGTTLVDFRLGAIAGFFTAMSGSGIFNLAVGDFIELRVLQNSGAALDLLRIVSSSIILWLQKVDRGG